MISNPINYKSLEWISGSKFEPGYFIGATDEKGEGNWMWENGQKVSLQTIIVFTLKIVFCFIFHGLNHFVLPKASNLWSLLSGLPSKAESILQVTLIECVQLFMSLTGDCCCLSKYKLFVNCRLHFSNLITPYRVFLIIS